MSHDAFLHARGLTKVYGHTKALRGLSIDFRAGEIHALCGHNGAGKSTLVKLLGGIEQPDAGEILVGGGPVELRSPRDAEHTGIAYVQQELSIIPTLSIEENVLLGGAGDRFFSRAARSRRRVRELLEMVGLGDIDPASSAAHLSPGEQQLLEIARGVGRDARLLILDEPTATLTDIEIERVFTVIRALAAQGAAIVFVSHRLGEVLRLCHRASILRDGQLIATRDVATLTRQELVDLMVGEIETESSVDVIDDVEIRNAEVVADVQHLSVEGRLEDFSIAIHSGEIVALAGQLGSGASEAIRSLAGMQPEARGRLVLGKRRVRLGDPRRAWRNGIHYVSNDRKAEGLFLDHPAGTNLVATRLRSLSPFGYSPRRARARAQELAASVGFDARRLRERIAVFSGGNQQKVFVGRALHQPTSRLIMLDEPTRGVDVAGRAEIHRIVRDAALAGNALLFASTELDEILDLATTVVTMRNGKIVGVAPRSQMTASALVRAMTHVEDEDES